MQKEKNNTLRRSDDGIIFALPPAWGEANFFNAVYINSIKSIYYERKH